MELLALVDTRRLGHLAWCGGCPSMLQNPAVFVGVQAWGVRLLRTSGRSILSLPTRWAVAAVTPRTRSRQMCRRGKAEGLELQRARRALRVASVASLGQGAR